MGQEILDILAYSMLGLCYGVAALIVVPLIVVFSPVILFMWALTAAQERIENKEIEKKHLKIGQKSPHITG